MAFLLYSLFIKMDMWWSLHNWFAASHRHTVNKRIRTFFCSLYIDLGGDSINRLGGINSFTLSGIKKFVCTGVFSGVYYVRHRSSLCRFSGDNICGDVGYSRVHFRTVASICRPNSSATGRSVSGQWPSYRISVDIRTWSAWFSCGYVFRINTGSEKPENELRVPEDWAY